MRSTLPLLVRIIPRRVIRQKGIKIEIIPEPVPQRAEKQETLIDILTKQKEMGSAWPPNLRIEPVVTKKTFERVKAEYRAELKALMKEN
jgi:hypothetical protein